MLACRLRGSGQSQDGWEENATSGTSLDTGPGSTTKRKASGLFIQSLTIPSRSGVWPSAASGLVSGKELPS